MPTKPRSSTYSTLTIEDFSGGWNPRDAWSEMADNELPDMMNVTLDERGGAVKRLGLKRVNPAIQLRQDSNIQSIYYSAATGHLIAQCLAHLYVSSDGGVTWVFGTSWNSPDRCHMVDFLGKVVCINPTQGVITWDGSAWAGPIANSPKGTCIAVWQNALWSVGDPAQPSRVTRSDLGAHTWPAAPITVDMRAKDDKPLTAIGGGQGMDVMGRDGVYVFKEDSLYRINTAATAAYTVEDYSYGASGPGCIATNGGVTAAISKKGIIAIAGESAATVVSDKIDLLFHPEQMTFAQAPRMVAASLDTDRIVFSLPFAGAQVNSLTLEYSPSGGWFAPHDFGLTAATAYAKNTRKLYGGKVGTNAASYGYLYDVFNGGSDDGAEIAARIQTRWFEPNTGNDVRFRRAVINGRGYFTFYVKRDYDTGVGESFPVAITGEGAQWGSAVWGIDTWSAPLQQDYVEVFSLGHGRSISIEIQEKSMLTSSQVKLLDVGEDPEVGGFALYGISVDMVGLGNS